MITQNDFLTGAKFCASFSKIVFWYNPTSQKKSKGVFRSEFQCFPIIEIDNQGFCINNENGVAFRIEFSQCKLIDDEE